VKNKAGRRDKKYAFSPALKAEVSHLCQSSKRPSSRSLREFAEAEIIVPDGEYKGELFRVHRQPFVGLLFDAIDSGRWNDFTITGPSQSGKTLCAFVIPTLYHVCELRDTSIIGLPDADMSGDKWTIDIRPVIEGSGFAHLLPETGAGSRGGRKVDAVQMANGATLKFMTGGGGDKSRAGFTARVLLVTETDGMDEAGAASREADKISQLQARQRSFPRHRRRTYKECTVSTESGRTWREYTTASTHSRIACPCAHCREYVTPEREHLIGWKDAPTQKAAQLAAHFACPSCGEKITPAQQREMNMRAVLVHDGQAIAADGTVSGDPPETDRLGFRWNAFNNLFLSAADHAADEWAADQLGENTEERINAEKEIRQFVWALPAEDAVEDLIDLDPQAMILRTGDTSATQRGIIPASHEFLTVGVDIRARQLHYVVKSSDAAANCRVIQHDILKVHSQRLGVEAAILRALRYLRDDVLSYGFRREGEADPLLPDLVFIDSGWTPDPIYGFCAECDRLPSWSPDDETGLSTFWPIVGRGHGQQYDRSYTHPISTGTDVKLIGPGMHVRLNKKYGRLYVVLDADVGKSFTHARWATPVDEPGACTIHIATGGDHQYFFKQITAERLTEEFIEGKGTVRRWVVKSRVNHYLDADSYSNVAQRWLGVEPARVTETDTLAGESPDEQPEADWQTPHGRPFY